MERLVLPALSAVFLGGISMIGRYIEWIAQWIPYFAEDSRYLMHRMYEFVWGTGMPEYVQLMNSNFSAFAILIGLATYISGRELVKDEGGGGGEGEAGVTDLRAATQFASPVVLAIYILMWPFFFWATGTPVTLITVSVVTIGMFMLFVFGHIASHAMNMIPTRHNESFIIRFVMRMYALATAFILSAVLFGGSALLIGFLVIYEYGALVTIVGGVLFIIWYYNLDGVAQRVRGMIRPA